MKDNPCTVCGGTDLNLVDGFYYCVECGTQDVNAQETVVEQTMLADGTFAHTTKRKVNIVIKDGIEMSDEWYKWHSWNIILCGLADRLVALGAKPSFKQKVLWVWMRYIKRYQNKDNMGTTTELQDNKDDDTSKVSIFNDEEEEEHKMNDVVNKSVKACRVISRNLLLSILLVALNLDKSDLQISHFSRFIREGRLGITMECCQKLLPKEFIKVSAMEWKSFKRETSYTTIHALPWRLFNALDLGTPLVPDLRKIIDNIVKELCLPDALKNLALSLLNLVPCKYFTQKTPARVPEYEVFAMSYVLVALKMCFGLDDDYEIKMSEVVDKINDEENHLKSYKLGMFADKTDRLFSFREWSNYLEFRKIMLCKHFLPMATQYGMVVGDGLFMEHAKERKKFRTDIRDEVTMDILNRIPSESANIIPISKFVPTLTPMTTYTDVILQHIEDTETKLLLSEDFTQYSLIYPCEAAKLQVNTESIATGVTVENKTLNSYLIGTLGSTMYDSHLVYVRNCENKNWLNTNPPTVKHMIGLGKLDNDKEYDCCYNSNTEGSSSENGTYTPNETDCKSEDGKETNEDRNETKCDINANEKERKLEKIDNEDESRNIFDDTFEDVDQQKEIKLDKDFDNGTNNRLRDDFQDDANNLLNEDFQNEFEAGQSDNLSLAQYNPKTFDRESTIRELISMACKKYKIPLPKEYNPKEPRKRKPALVHIGAEQSEPKKRRTGARPGDVKRELDNIMTAYYTSLETDIFNKLSEQIRSTIHNFEETGDVEETANQGNQSNSEENNEEPLLPGHLDGTEEVIMNESDDKDFNVEDFIRKSDPDFDEKTHDIKQLYLKFEKGFDFDFLLDCDDPELERILDKNVGECHDNTSEPDCAEDLNGTDESDAEEDIPLTVVKEDVDLVKIKEAQSKEKLEPLIKNLSNTKEFRYWCKHYSTPMFRQIELVKIFDNELNENCPVSFDYILTHCAAMSECTKFILYKSVQNLEKTLKQFLKLPKV